MRHLLPPAALIVASAAAIAGCTTAEPRQVEVVSPAPPPPTAPSVVETPTAPPAPKCEVLSVDVPPLDDSMLAAPEIPMVDPTGHGMTSFYERLARLMRGRTKDHVRIGIYGDSNMTMDFIAGPLRRDLQARYGDAGHGFIALARPWAHYRHMDVVQQLSPSIESYAVTTTPTHDGAYGYSGIVSESAGFGPKVRVATAPDTSPVGRSAGRFDVFYLKGTKRGAFDLVVDDQKSASLDSEASTRGVGIFRTEVPDGPHRFDVVLESAKYVRLLGAVIERDKPGIVVDNLGVGAMSTRCIPMEDPAVSAPMLAYRRYDLVILMTGAADIYSLDIHPQLLKQVIDLHRKARPDVSFLLVSPPDRGVTQVTRKLLELGEQRAQAAREEGTGYWDLIAAQGGPTSMMTFIRKDMALNDQIHFTESGGAWVGRRLEHAILSDFARYLAEHPTAGCDDTIAPELEPWPAGPAP